MDRDLGVWDPAGVNDKPAGVLLAVDVDANGIVNILDSAAAKSELFQPLTVANFRSDVDVSGVLNVLDLGVVKANLFKTATCP